MGRLLGGTGGRRSAPSSPRPSAPPGRPASDGGSPPPDGQRRYPGDFRGIPAVAYAPKPDGQPDPGEIVRTWVPFEEDNSVGKDRPVLLVGSDGDWLLAVMLTSKDHDHDADDEARWGRFWMDVGTGDWDPQGRESEIRLDRVLTLDDSGVRREGAALDRVVFDRVVEAMREHWPDA